MNREQIAAIVASGRKTAGQRDGDNVDAAMSDFDEWRDGAGGVERQHLVETLALARPGARGSLKQLVQENLALREEVIVRNVDLATTGPVWNYPTNQNFWFGHNPGTLPTQQPASHVTRIHSLEIEADQTATIAELNHLRRYVNFVLHYGDKRPDYVIPMAHLLVPNVVENATDAASVGVKQPFGERFVIPTRDQLVILPNEQVENWSMQVAPGTIPATVPGATSRLVTVRAFASVFQPMNRR